jgi:hypothetical protein
MPSKLTKKFGIASARYFMEGVTKSTSNVYIFMGAPFPWRNEANPPEPEEDIKSEAELFDNLIAAKKLSPLDVRNVVRRIDWTRNTVYAEYDDEDKNLLDKDFYVMNSEFNVYKCISNNNGAASLVEPKGTPLLIFTTSDNYRWKFMYTVSVQDQLRFLTRNWLPISVDNNVKAAAIDGGIEHVKISSGGRDFSVRTRIEVTGDNTRPANILAQVRLGTIINYQIIDSGLKYRNLKTSFSQQGAGKFANVRAIASPVNGHGFDPIQELGSNYLMFNIRTEGTEGGTSIFPPTIKFRQIGLLKDPKLRDGVTLASNATLSYLDKIFLNQVNGAFLQDEYIIGQSSGANIFCITSNVTSRSNVADISFIQGRNSTSNYITPNVGEILLGVTSGASGRVTGVAGASGGDDYGEIIYIENISPISRSRDQTENLHLVIEF